VSSPILVGYCPDTRDLGPVNFAAAAARMTDAPLVVAAVRPGGSMLERLAAGEFHRSGDDGDHALDRLRAALAEKGITATVRVEEHSSPARGLAAVVEELSPRLLVLGSTRRGGVRRVLPGSTAERLIHGASCPVVVVPHGHEHTADGLRTVGAGFAPTPEGRAALRAAALLARAAGAQLRAITVLDPKHAEEQSPGLLAASHGDHDPSEERYVRERLAGSDALDTAIAEVAEGVAVEPDILFNDPVDGLVAASSTLDLLVLGSRSYGPMHSVMLGGVSRRVIAQAGCPTLVIPRGTLADVDALVAARTGAGASG
jgi:nucleotide-binding universal stress UspA family protein